MTPLDLPYRHIYELEVFDQDTGTIPKALDAISNSQPLLAKGWVPIEETAYAQDGKDLRRYSVKHSYEPYFRPLADACLYLDVLVHVVTNSPVPSYDMNSLVLPRMAVVLCQDMALIEEKLSEYHDRIISLCASDVGLSELGLHQLLSNSKVKNRSAQHNPSRSYVNQEVYEQQDLTPTIEKEIYGAIPAPCPELICPTHSTKILSETHASTSAVNSLVIARATVKSYLNQLGMKPKQPVIWDSTAKDINRRIGQESELDIQLYWLLTQSHIQDNTEQSKEIVISVRKAGSQKRIRTAVTIPQTHYTDLGSIPRRSIALRDESSLSSEAESTSDVSVVRSRKKCKVYRTPIIYESDSDD
ncbi:hypothetical protein BGW38_001706 [Lunasporangiospora selenospora]|uniref:Uncharacterized protein n=1 Tax=Lunasporangiospora selenospora TaxID=979761 RepID=A0A9P6KDW7_9FUNG|nr:hypothetical protein BGW38_001706 [Lunasporangiospora selenospora]